MSLRLDATARRLAPRLWAPGRRVPAAPHSSSSWSRLERHCARLPVAMGRPPGRGAGRRAVPGKPASVPDDQRAKAAAPPGTAVAHAHGQQVTCAPTRPCVLGRERASAALMAGMRCARSIHLVLRCASRVGHSDCNGASDGSLRRGQRIPLNALLGHSSGTARGPGLCGTGTMPQASARQRGQRQAGEPWCARGRVHRPKGVAASETQRTRGRCRRVAAVRRPAARRRSPPQPGFARGCRSALPT